MNTTDKFIFTAAIVALIGILSLIVIAVLCKHAEVMSQIEHTATTQASNK